MALRAIYFMSIILGDPVDIVNVALYPERGPCQREVGGGRGAVEQAVRQQDEVAEVGRLDIVDISLDISR